MPEYLRIPAIRVVQPLGVFYAACVPADKLLQLAYSNPLIAQEGLNHLPFYALRGAQRSDTAARHREIGAFIDTAEAAFPNTIILAANYDESGTALIEDDARRWQIVGQLPDRLELVVPTDAPLARIVDGQHRLHGFKYATKDRKAMPLLCSVYLDLPSAFQAYLFATINFNQKKVDRSLAYELFGVSVEDEPQNTWSPDKAAVFICRKLNVEADSPFYRRIRVAAQNEDVLFGGSLSNVDWRVSTSTVVDGILGLISKQPKVDRSKLHSRSVSEGRNRHDLGDDDAPLRTAYVTSNDVLVYTAVRNFFEVVDNRLWRTQQRGSYIAKTVGVQAMFDVLARILSREFASEKDIRTSYFGSFIEKVCAINFADGFFEASGRGRVRLRNVVLLKLQMVELSALPELDREDYQRLAGA